MWFPNGMAIIDDTDAGRRRVARRPADRVDHRRRRHARRTAGSGPQLGQDEAPDGICVDESGAIWYASVPQQHCVRVAEGGEVLETVSVDRGAFSCMLGGDDGRTLYVVANHYGPQGASDGDRADPAGRACRGQGGRSLHW